MLNLHPGVDEDLLKEAFAPFGTVNYCSVVRDPVTNASTGVLRAPGYDAPVARAHHAPDCALLWPATRALSHLAGEAYVQFTDVANAEKAIQGFNGVDFMGKKLTVQKAPMAGAALPPPPPLPPGGLPQGLDPTSGLPLPPPPPVLPAGLLPVPPPIDPAAAIAAAAAAAAAFASAAGGAPPSGFPPPPSGLPQPPDALAAAAAPAAGTGEVDDLDEAENNRSFRLNAQSRAALMSRLASSAGLQAPSLPSVLGGGGAGGASGGPAVPQSVLLEQGLLGPASPIPTPCLLLKNSEQRAASRRAPPCALKSAPLRHRRRSSVAHESLLPRAARAQCSPRPTRPRPRGRPTWRRTCAARRPSLATCCTATWTPTAR